MITIESVVWTLYCLWALSLFLCWLIDKINTKPPMNISFSSLDELAERLESINPESKTIHGYLAEVNAIRNQRIDNEIITGRFQIKKYLEKLDRHAKD